ncbi:MAG TPA: hypothetical protein VKZ44_08985, partial [Taishania sp.]|nr:hypothetical protein [Taishania sp.]
MKKQIFFASLLFASVASVTFASDFKEATQVHSVNTIKEAVSVTISVTSERGPVAGALIKITAGGLTIGAGTTDANGNTTINIPSYNKQLVRIDVTHSMFKDDKKVDFILENGSTIQFTLKPKTESLDAAAAREAESVKRQEEAKKAQEEANRQKEEAQKRAEQVNKEAEEARKAAEAKKAEAKAIQEEAEKKRKEQEARL